MSGDRKMKLGAFLMAGGHHIAAWRHPFAHAEAGVDIAHFIALARIAERGKFDMIFVEDAAAIRERNPEMASQAARSTAFEPLSLLAALAVNTSHIGLVATASTTYNEPYGLARTFASIDLLSGGRAGWNLVTSASELEAENFASSGLRPHSERYERAEEFADAVLAIWDGVEDGAYLPQGGETFADRAKLHPVHHRGKHFSVEGLLESPRSPQGRPIMVQAGASDVGKELAARTADVVFAASQTIGEARAYYADVKSRLAKYGRQLDDMKIMPGISPIVGTTEEEAKAKYRALQELIPDAVGVALLASYLSIQDLSAYPLDGPLPEMPETNLIQSRQQLIIDLGRREKLSIRELARHFAGARGHWQVAGTPAQIADAMEERFSEDAADGFNLMAPLFPSGLEDFVTLVVPELRRRGLFREEYEGRTLRRNLGVDTPAKR
ncbi:FMN-dependent oxidoreductase, nitrilotriacetate monooxygenase family [Rhizobium leguminosarum bv. trifolii WSM2297]|uniref:FMN-dependent oxidoreductase, nitrilotriacetate monooxygenase family n=1 Tax=Rhizobium leguminosarum bv. trifolii WSM2297 TaxID=754762 RepID=J0KYX4_RHILT|nr:LLM class flavin-dependent oxidoreductase [Rhizobium leguminosarum]EJC83029.1 FMN-dependent oxidoreductase, nitrilotriacetate monooxygenase family [Rhizobium leguminosarum bv. trifolii WSM2297]